MTLREKRHRDAVNTLSRTLAQRDGCIAKLVKYEAKLKELRRQVVRLERAMAAVPHRMIDQTVPPPEKPKVKDVTDIPPSEFPIADQLDDEPAIPTFLQRKRDAEHRDKIAREAILAEKAERKRNKARVRIETLKAKQRGDTKRMPLAGKAAIAHIQNG